MSAIKKPEEYTKYEKARILGARALQISANAPILVKLQNEELQKINYDPIKIAEIEFERGVLPITVKRPLPKKIEKKETHLIEIVKEEDLEEETIGAEKTEAIVEEKETETVGENLESKTEDEKENAELDESDIVGEFEKVDSEEEI